MATTQTVQEKTSTKLRPLGNRVIVKRLEAEEKLRGGILLPENAKKKQERAEVVAIGPGKREKNGNLTPVPVKVGDIILMEKYSGQEITIDEQEFVIVKADELIAIVEG
jgi:chaperonin GroES